VENGETNRDKLYIVTTTRKERERRAKGEILELQKYLRNERRT
jgi:hypothetical protein